MRRRVVGQSLIAGLCLTFAAEECAKGGMDRTGASAATLRTDSVQYTVRFVSPMYRATIGYVYTNHTRNAVSASYCRTPYPPSLEKDIGGGHWVLAYSPVSLMCLTQPPFRIAAGGTYRGTLQFGAARRGANLAPALQIDSIPGTYRLRWVLRAGPTPDDSAPLVDAVSAPFRLVEP